jgi:CheY-like chemotaxis protein
VHEVTQLVLSKFEFDRRPLRFFNCYSGKEARQLLQARSDIALILLDVVMESEHAGLDVVKFIREELQNRHVRIILRTGQPGQAPEEEVIRSYEINDYKEKTELTTRKMSTMLCSALRSYRDIVTLEESRTGLRRSIDAITRISDSRNLRAFASAVLEQLNLLIGMRGLGPCEGRIAAYAASSSDGRFKVLAATQEFEGHDVCVELAQLPLQVRQAIECALEDS